MKHYFYHTFVDMNIESDVIMHQHHFQLVT